MTPLEIILTATSILFCLLYLLTFISSTEKSRLMKGYDKVLDSQESFIKKLRTDYDNLALSYFNLASHNKQLEMKEAIEEFIECCSEGMEIEHFKEKFKEVLK